MRISKNTLVAVTIGSLVAGLSGCQKEEGPVERAGREIDRAVEKVGKSVEKAGEKIQDAAKGGK